MCCIWKARNDRLFSRKNPLPRHVHTAAKALTNQSCDVLHYSNQNQVQHARTLEANNQSPMQR